MERGNINHIFPCSPQRGKISQLTPTCCIGKTILGWIYIYIYIYEKLTVQLVKLHLVVTVVTQPATINDYHAVLVSLQCPPLPPQVSREKKGWKGHLVAIVPVVPLLPEEGNLLLWQWLYSNCQLC